MSMYIPRTWYPVIGAIVLLAVIAAGCTTAPSGPGPVTTPATPATTSPPATPPATTTAMPTTTGIRTTVATTPPATTIPVTQTTPVPPPPAAVTILNFAFSPASVTVPRGTTVIWTNRDPASHTVVNDGSTVFGAGQIFSSPSFGLGQNYSFTFTNAGTYPYHCGIHLSMHGTVIVM